MALARARGLALRLDDFLLAADLRPLLRLAVLRFAELRPAEPRLVMLLRFVELRLAELRFAVRLDLPRAADFLRDDFFAAIDVCSCRGGLFTLPDSKIRAHNLRSVSGWGFSVLLTVSCEGEKCVHGY